MSRPRQIRVRDPDPRWGGADDAQLHVVLVHPEIPPNTGNIARLCAATGAHLHLIEPLGFALEDRHLRRAGLDYWPEVEVTVHADWAVIAATFPRERLHLFTAHAPQPYTEARYCPGDVLVFGCESRGLDPALRAPLADRLRAIPMRPGAVRSLNLSNAVAVAIYEAARQGASALAAAADVDVP